MCSVQKGSALHRWPVIGGAALLGEVRCRWPMPTLDVPDEHGHSFGEYVTAILQENTSDFAAYQDADKPLGAEQLWTTELEQQWSHIKLAAGRMFAAHRDYQRRQREKRRRKVRRAVNRHRSVRQR
jgi:hypothetical protein